MLAADLGVRPQLDVGRGLDAINQVARHACREARAANQHGISFIATMNAVQHLRSGALVCLLPDWHADIGPISLYFSGRQRLPAKTRVFVDYIVDGCRGRGLASLLAAT
jgi:DNA-binding transcriptional LysR family regulator